MNTVGKRLVLFKNIIVNSIYRFNMATNIVLDGVALLKTIHYSLALIEEHSVYIGLQVDT